MSIKQDMSKGYRRYQQHLHIDYTPAEYVVMRDKIRYGGYFSPERMKFMSSYLVSRCPFCGAERKVLLDIYSLLEWPQSSLGFGQVVGHAEDESERESVCKHFVAIQRFANLEGIVPVETFTFSTKLHLPFVIPPHLPIHVPSIAVIHSIPICRIEAVDNGDVYNLFFNRFVKPQASVRFVDELKSRLGIRYKPLAEASPRMIERLAKSRFTRRYTGFFVAYYSEDPKAMRTGFVDKQLGDTALHDPDFTMADVNIVEDMNGIRIKYPQGYDLANWVAQGKLQWLDLSHPEMPLKTEPVDKFPYINLYDITGQKKHFEYRLGEIMINDY